MMKLSKFVFAIATLSISLSTTCLAINVTPRQIAEESLDRNAIPYEYDVLRLKIINGKQITQRVMRQYVRREKNGRYKYLLTFVDPASLRGLAYLGWQNKDNTLTQWMYQPTLKQLKRLTGSSIKQRFAGTDFRYEDLMPQDPKHYTYQRLRDKTVGGHFCYAISMTPKKAFLYKTNYSERIFYISRKNYLPIQIDFYGKRRKRLIKQQNSYGISKIPGTSAYRANQVVMTSFKGRRVTQKSMLTVLKRNTKKNAVPAYLFTKQYLIKRKHIDFT